MLPLMLFSARSILRALARPRRARTRCFLEPGAKRGSVRGIYRDLRRTQGARRSSFARAEIAFIQKDHYGDWLRRRETGASRAALSQLPHVSRLLVAKARLAELVGGKPYAPTTFQDACKGRKTGIWVQKPSVGGRGNDVTFLRDPSDWEKTGYVLQRYLDDPYLIDGRKFDVRVLAKIDDRGELRVHPDGLIRCAAQAYDADSLDARIHNSNVCFQQREKVLPPVRMLLSRSPLAGGALDQIRAILHDVLDLLRQREVFRGTRDFEMLGIDFLVGADEKIWLLEINQHPGWHSSCRDTGGFYLAALESLF